MTILSIPDMSCGHCKATIEQTLKALDPGVTLDFDMPARTVGVHTDADLQEVRTALQSAGYAATVAG